MPENKSKTVTVQWTERLRKTFRHTYEHQSDKEHKDEKKASVKSNGNGIGRFPGAVRSVSGSCARSVCGCSEQSGAGRF